MGGIFGGGGGNSQSEPAALGLRVQTSAYGMTLPLVYGRTRITANIIWYGDFVATAHEQEGGKGGDSVLGVTYTYTASVMFALCEGLITGVHAGWKDKDYMTLAQLEKIFTFFNGAYPQTPWTYLLSKHGYEALGYQGVAYAGIANYDLGTNSSLPNHSFEVSGKYSTSAESAKQAITFTTPVYGSPVGLTVIDETVMWQRVYVLSMAVKGALKIGDIIEFFTTGTLPAGLTLGKVYVVTAIEEYQDGYVGKKYKVRISEPNRVRDFGMNSSGIITSHGSGTLTAKKVTRSDVINAVANTFVIGDIVYLEGAVSKPFKTGIEYYIAAKTTDTFKLSATKGGATIQAENAGSGLAFTASIGGNPRDIIFDFLTSKIYGAELAPEKFGDMSTFSAFCVANGIAISPAYTEQAPAHEMLTNLMQVTNSAAYFSEGVLKIVPLSDVDATGNGSTYYAPNTPVYDLTDDDFIVTDDDPVKVYRNSTADSYNCVKVEFYNSENQYNIEIATASDQASIDVYGMRALDPITAHMITDASIARLVAQMILQRSLFVRNTYEFTLSWKYSLLEPTDIVTITDIDLGFLLLPVRIISTEEADDGTINVIAEDYPAGVSNSATYPSGSGLGWKTNTNVTGGDVVAPAFFEVPAVKSTTGLAVGVAVAGNSADYGGCQVWVSYDGSSYTMLGEINGSSRYGITTGDITSAVNQVQGVALAGNGGTLLGASELDAQNMVTASIIGDEYVAYSGSALVSANNYNLTLAQRGAQSTKPAAHLTGSKFIRLDKATLVSGDLDLSLIGSTLHFKFLSFNQYGGARQALAEVTEYVYEITGVMAKLPPSDVTGFTYATSIDGVTFSWNDIADGDRKDYELRKGATWATADSFGFYGSNSAKLPPQPAGSSTWLVKARDFFGNMSDASASTVLTVTAPLAPSVTASVTGADYLLSWTAPASGFTIDHYELRIGADWATGTYLATTGGQVYQSPVDFGGTVNFMVAAVDVAGNVGAAGSDSVVILLPTAPIVTAQVIDNNVLFYWNDTAATLPIGTYELRKGATFATAQVIGTKSGLFTTYFETTSGSFTYWVVPIDSAGNFGAPASVTSTVSQPPDYLLKANYDSALTGTLSNAIKDSYGVTMPINTTEQVGAHFTTRSWASAQDQINAGYPLWIEPSQSGGYYEESIDYGTTLAACKVTVSPTVQAVAGTPAMTYTISLSSNNITWIDYVGYTEVFGTNFRYVKVRCEVASSGGDDLVQLTALNIRLDVKLKNDAGTIAVVSTDNSAAISGAPAGGTTVLFNVPFVSITGIQVSAQGTTVAYTPIYDFTGSTVNPIGFKVYLYNSAGARVSGTISWSAKGY